MDAKSFMNQLKRDQYFPIVIFHGEEKYKIEELLTQLKTKILKEDSTGFNFDQYDGSDLKVDQLLNSVRTLPFAAKRRLVLVRDFHKINAKNLESLKPLVEDPVETTCLVLTADKADARKAFFKKAAKVGAVIKFDRIYENELPRWVKYLAGKQSKQISDQALMYLSETIGTDLMSLANEIEKTAIYVGDEQSQIELEDCEKVVSHLKLSNVFELTECIGQRKISQAALLVENLIHKGGEPLFLLAMISRQLRNLWMAVGLLQAGVTQKEVSSLLRLHPRFAQDFFRQCRHWKTEEFPDIFEKLIVVDRNLKMNLSGSAAGQLMDLLLHLKSK